MRKLEICFCLYSAYFKFTSCLTNLRNNKIQFWFPAFCWIAFVFNLEQFLTLFLRALVISKSGGHLFSSMLLNFGLLDTSSDWFQAVCFGQKNHTALMCPSQCELFRGTCCFFVPFIDGVILILWLGWCICFAVSVWRDGKLWETVDILFLILAPFRFNIHCQFLSCLMMITKWL